MDTECIVRLNGSTSVTRYPLTNVHMGNKNNFISQKGHFRGADLPQRPPPATPYATDQKYTHNPAGVKKSRGSCYYCNGPHQLFMCQSFDRMSNELKYERLRTLSICVKCLRKANHPLESCKMRNCECGSAHNKLLCDRRQNTVTALSAINTEPIIAEIDASLLGSLSVFAHGLHDDKAKVRAISDGGSHINLITTRLVQRLQLKVMKLAVPLEGPGRKCIPIKSVVDLNISPAENGSCSGE